MIVRKLRLTVPFHSDETLTSYLSRLATAFARWLSSAAPSRTEFSQTQIRVSCDRLTAARSCTAPHSAGRTGMTGSGTQCHPLRAGRRDLAASIFLVGLLALTTASRFLACLNDGSAKEWRPLTPTTRSTRAASYFIVACYRCLSTGPG